MISRIIEKTDTLIPRVAELATTRPWCSVTWGSKPDHAKFALFTRQDESRPDSAILGGINFGDRFTSWDDYAVRLPSPYAEELRCSLLGDATGAVDECEVAGGAAGWDETSVDAARTVALASPVVALFTLMTSGLLVTSAAAVPLAAVASDPALATGPLTATLATGATAAGLGAAFATACDGKPFTLTRELAGFARSLVYDRSLAGDVLAPLRRAYRHALPEDANESIGEWRHLPIPSLSSAPVSIACNRRDQRRYEIEPTFRALFADPSLTRYKIAMAYLGHRWGVELIEFALRRGAQVELLMPYRSNVYACENLKAAQTLVDAGWPNLRVFLLPDMVHAKATLARDEAGEKAVAFLGSANLVRGSMNLPVHCGLLPCALRANAILSPAIAE